VPGASRSAFFELANKMSLSPAEYMTVQKIYDHTHVPHPLGLLRLRRERPCGHAGEKGDELAPPHAPSPIYADARVSDVGTPAVEQLLHRNAPWCAMSAPGSCAGMASTRSVRLLYPKRTMLLRCRRR
jgi:hypothetical protein